MKLIDRLARKGKRLTAGRQYAQFRCLEEQLADELGTGSNQVLAIVQEQQHLFALHKVQQRLKQRLGRWRMQAERLRDELRYERWLTERCEIHHPDAVRKHVAHCCGNLDRKPCLATATRATERDEARRGKQTSNFGQLALAPHETR